MKVHGLKYGEFLSGLLLLLFAGFLIEGALHMPLGTVSNPGAGFIPLCLGILLGILSLLLSATAGLKHEPGQGKKSKESLPARQKSSMAIILALVGYALIFERAGFFLSTFLLTATVTHLFRPGRALMTIGFSIVASGIAYFIFAILLRVTLP